MDISLCMIVKDEESTLDKCLNSVAPAIDEIIVVDTGSSDTTKDIAARHGARLFDFTWNDDFSAARNFSFSKAGCDYLFWLDADDYLPTDDLTKLLILKKDLSPDVDAVKMLYYLSETSRAFVRRIRLIKNRIHAKWHARVHEYLEVNGKILPSGICVQHAKQKSYSERNLNIYRQMIENKQVFTARDTFYYANELFSNQLYMEAIKTYRRFLKMKDASAEEKRIAALHLGYCLYHEGDEYGEIEAYLLSLEFRGATAECCCVIGNYFLRFHQYELAAEWFKEALSLPTLSSSYSLYNPDYEHYIPLSKLSLCYDALGDFKTACAFNEAALPYANDPSECLSNRERYFIKTK